MHDPHNDKDHDIIIIKPLTFTGTILLSAGVGLVAGLLICGVFGGAADDNRADDQQTVTPAEISHSSSSPNRPSTG